MMKRALLLICTLLYVFYLRPLQASPYTIYAYGDGTNNGELGDGTTMARTEGIQITNTLLNSTIITQMVTKYTHSLALGADGSLFAWGSDGARLGTGVWQSSSQYKSSPVRINTAFLNGKTIKKLATSSVGSTLLTTDGSIYSCGSNNPYGEVGDGTNVMRLSFVQLSSTLFNNSQVVDLVSFLTGSVALTAEGGVYYWGGESLFHSNITTCLTTNFAQRTPHRYPSSFFNERNVTKLAAGLDFAMALTSDNYIFTWGSNSQGQLGMSQTDQRNLVCQGKAVELNSTYWEGKTIISMAAGAGAAFILAQDGVVYYWGKPMFTVNPAATKLGPEMFYDRKISVISNAYGAFGFIADDGTLFTWSTNFNGILGVPSAVYQYGNLYPSIVPNTKAKHYISGFRYSIIYACPKGYFGDDCSLPRCFNKLSNDSSVCSGNGRCTAPDTCICNSGYQGNNCERASCFGISGLESSVCSNAGKCETTDVCTCFDGYYGQRCQFQQARNRTAMIVWGYDQSWRTANFPGWNDKEIVAISTSMGAAAFLASDNTVLFWQDGAVAVGNVWKGKTISQIANGDSHYLVLATDGSVFAWGYNNDGSLGDGSIVSRTHSDPVLLPIEYWNNKTVKLLRACATCSFVVTSDNKIYSWGSNGQGQIAHPQGFRQFFPTLIPNPVWEGKDIADLSSLGTHVLLLTSDGLVYSWGNNNVGQCGNNVLSSAQPPRLIDSSFWGNKPIIAIATGDAHSMALTHDGQLYTWGDNTFGQLGLGHTLAGPYPTPSLVTTTGIISTIIAGTTNSYLKMSDGSYYGWGANGGRTLGFRTDTALVSTPVLLNAFPTKQIKILKSSGLTFVFAEIYHFDCSALNNCNGHGDCTADNHCTCDDGYGGDDCIPICYTKLANDTDVCSGHGRCDSPGTCTCNQPGYLGLDCGTVACFGIDANEFTACSASGVCAGPNTCECFEGYTGPACEYLNETIEVAPPLQVFTWGLNQEYGQLGLGDMVNRFRYPGRIGFRFFKGKNVTSITAGSGHFLAISSDGSLFSWGWNEYGQLGINSDRRYHLRPTQVKAESWPGESIVAVAAGDCFSVVLTNVGNMYTWGCNDKGSVGDGSGLTSVLAPVALGNIGGVPVIKIVAGYYHALALSDNGEVIEWGGNSYGQLGTGDQTDALVPINVDTASMNPSSSVLNIAAGNFASFVIFQDGTVFTWGEASFNQQLFQSTSSFTPISLPSSSFNNLLIASISLSETHAVALTTDGKVLTWGSNANWQLGTAKPPVTGDGEKTEEDKKEEEKRDEEKKDEAKGEEVDGVFQVDDAWWNGKTIVKVVAALEHTMALAEDGTLFAWGNYGDANDPSNVFINSGGPSTDHAFNGLIVTDITGGKTADAAIVKPYCFGLVSSDGAACSSGNGSCVATDYCECKNGYGGEQCEMFSCYGITQNETSTVCSGRGECVGPNICLCDSNTIFSTAYGYYEISLNERCAIIGVRHYIDKDITRDLLLNATNGANVTYLVLQQVTITAGSTLTIEPGVLLMMSPGASIVVAGKMLAEGNQSNPIIFAPSVPGSHWGTIQLQRSSSNSIMRHVTIKYGGGSSKAVIQNMSASSIIDAVHLENSASWGVLNCGTFWQPGRITSTMEHTLVVNESRC